MGPPAERRAVIEQFVEFCLRRGWRVGFHQVSAENVRLYQELGFRRMKIGADAVVDLQQFTLDGSAMKEFRNTVNRLTRQGYLVGRFEPPPEPSLDRSLDPGLLRQLQQVSNEWLALPHNRERRFTLGSFSPEYIASTVVYAVFDPDGKVAAFLNLVPSYRPDVATVDLMRRRAHTINGVMDFLFARTFLDLKARGYQRFSLGMAPIAESSEERPNAEERLVIWAARHSRSWFRSESLRRFKAKYATIWEPRYEVYHSRWDLPRLALALFDVTETREKRN